MSQAMIRDRAVIEAILALRGQEGTIEPAAVVEAARPKDSPLHRFFDWEDTTAAQAWRVEQARRLLRITVTILPSPGGDQTVRAFVALKSDGKGYRSMLRVLDDQDQRNEMIQAALDDMAAFRRKHRHLMEVAEVIEAMSAAERRLLRRRVS